jgi:hypothetical protein
MAVTLTVQYRDDVTAAYLTLVSTDAVVHTISVTRSVNVGAGLYVRGLRNVQLLANATVTTPDTEAPLGVPFSYVLTVDGAVTATLPAHTYAGPWLVDEFPTWAVLRHLVRADLSRAILISEMGDTDRPAAFGDFTPIAGGLPIVVTTVRRGRRGTLTLITLDDDSAIDLLNLFLDGTVLQLAADPRFHIGSNGFYFAASGLTNARVTQDGYDPAKTWTIDYIEVDAPVSTGITVTLNTYTSVQAAFATYNVLTTSGLHYSDLPFVNLAGGLASPVVDAPIPVGA